MSPVLASPFKSPMSVLAKIKQWSSRKAQRHDSPSPATPTHAQKSLQTCDSAGGQGSDCYCTPQSSHTVELTTPDSGVHTWPTSQRLPGAGRLPVMQGVSRPIPIMGGNTPGPRHCARLRAISASLHLKKETLSKDAHSEVKEEAELDEPPPQNRNVQRPSVTSIASSAVSFATTTTTLPSENSYSDGSEYGGGSWCLKLSDLDSPDCLSPQSPGWQRLISEAGKLPSKQSCEPELRVERVEDQVKELEVNNKLREGVGCASNINTCSSSDGVELQVKKLRPGDSFR